MTTSDSARAGAVREREGERLRHLAVLFVLFFLSGATGLIYEIMWNRKLTLVFGATVYAVTTILTVFFTGLALGAYLIGGRVDRSRNPLRLYVTLELAIGLFGLFSPLLFKGIEGIYALVHPFVGDGLPRLTAVRFVLSFLGLLVPTTLLGATLPVLVKLVVRGDAGVAGHAGRLYAVNSIGAALGTLLATTALIPLFGVNGSLYLAGSVNIAIAGAAWLLFRRHVEAAGPAPPAARHHYTGIQRYVIALFGVAGFLSMAYQVAWFRLLVQITGTSVYTFGLMLSVFIVGIGLGSAVATRLLRRLRSPVIALLVVEGVASAYTLFAVSRFDRLPALYVDLSHGLIGAAPAAVDPFVFELLSKAAIAAVVFLLPTLMFGAAFPLVAAVYAQRSAASGRDVGVVYAVNTVGGVLGSFCGGFLLLPFLGTQMTLAAMSVCGVVLAAAFALPLTRGPARAAVPVVGLLLVLGGVLRYDPWNPLMIDAGPYVVRWPDAAAMIEQQALKHLHYYREGVSVNVSVTGTRREANVITINGKPMASTLITDVANQYMLGHLPMLLHPDPQSSMVIGLGAGMTFGALVRHGKPADVVEISPEVVDGTRRFARYNRSVLDRPNAHVIFDDGRNYLMTTRKKYDVITEDPLDPFFMGSGYLYDIEHFQNAKRALNPGGVMCQYLPLYQLGLEESRIIMKTFHEVFPYVTVWFAFNDILMIGTEAPLKVDYERLRQRVHDPAIAQDLREIGIDNEFDLLANYLFDQERIPEVGAGLPLNTDDYPIIEFLAPRSILRQTQNENLLYYVALRDKTAPDLIDTGGLTEARAGEVRARYARYYAAREHIMKLHLGTRGAPFPVQAEASAAVAAAAPEPIASHYLAYFHRVAGKSAFDGGQVALALQEYGRSLAFRPDDTEALNRMGDLLLQAGRKQDGLALFRRSLALDDTQVVPLGYLAADSMGRGALPEAAAYLRQCLGQDPEYGPCVKLNDALGVGG